jgi:hypothetical protein
LFLQKEIGRENKVRIRRSLLKVVENLKTICAKGRPIHAQNTGLYQATNFGPEGHLIVAQLRGPQRAAFARWGVSDLSLG